MTANLEAFLTKIAGRIIISMEIVILYTIIIEF